MKFIQVTLHNGDKVSINLDAISHFHPYGAFTRIMMVGSKAMFDTEEKYESLVTRVRVASKP